MKPLLRLHLRLLLLPLFCLSSSLLLQPSTSDLESDRSALSAFRAAVGGRSLLWNISSPPCSWTGIICDNKQQIIELHFPGMGLSGTLPSGVLGNLTTVQTLSLRYNALSGPIPPDIANLTALRNLYLQGNFFSGEIPSSLSSLANLVRLNLAKNKLSGSIPSSLNGLARLKTLYLEQNQLNGTIPDLTLKLDQFNVSFNSLTGSIPSSLSGMPRSAFEGTSLCGPPLGSCNGTDTGGGNKLSGGAIAGIVIGSVFGILLILLILIFLCRKRKVKEEANDVEVAAVPSAAATTSKQASAEIPRKKEAGGPAGDSLDGVRSALGKSQSDNKSLIFFGKNKRVFDLEDLLRASAEVLGKGTFGTTYKAALEMGGLVVAVKRLKELAVPEKDFREKMKEIGEVEHENLVPLRAYYYNRDEKLLVYDYMPTGSLSALLHAQIATSTSIPNRVDGYKAPELNEEGVDLPRWVQSVVREEWTAEVFDLELLRYQDVEEDMVQLLQLALECTAQHPDKRPSMAVVTARIEELGSRSTTPPHHNADDGSSQTQSHQTP
ncbi:hypothetical protein SAY86_000794 [Trapa natans]|uniref:Protein kinase domain-containing protein n=1 Tax=Trapa natans TaxID=22666 RepID=A0AAN7RLT3_TRANT|nr:hypothetical protein SAY86_000794 [Trapa natans]